LTFAEKPQLIKELNVEHRSVNAAPRGELKTPLENSSEQLRNDHRNCRVLNSFAAEGAI
jgi:hypothetical protein